MKPAVSSLKRRLNPLAALADQAWLSLLSLAVSVAFIRGGSKEEYGFYVLMLAPLMLVQSIQNALVNSPLATFLPTVGEQERPLLQQTAVSMHIALALTAALLGMVGIALYLHFKELPTGAGLMSGFVAAVLGTVAREAQRSLAYVQGKGISALKGDLFYGVTLMIGVGWAVTGQQLTAAVVLWLSGIAGMLPLVFRLRHRQPFRLASEQMNQLWTCGRWALPSVLVTWLNLSAYPFFAERALGLAAVADLGASRLFVMPVGLVITAWSNWFRPRISGWFATGETAKIRRLSALSAGAGLACLAAASLVLISGYPYAEHLLGVAYQGLLPLILMWLVFFGLSLCRNVLMATLMTDASGYKTLHHITWMALALSLPCFLTTAHLGAVWVIGVLCVAELFQLLLIGAKALSYWEHGPSKK